MATAFDQEWAQLKAGTSDDVSMRLASADKEGDDGSPGGGLKASKNAWITAGVMVGALGGAVRGALKSLEEGQKGGAGSDPLTFIPVINPALAAGGVQCVAAQQEVYGTWQPYLRDVALRCESLVDLMGIAGSEFARGDGTLAYQFEKLNDGYTDTPDIGGKGKG